MSVSDWLTRAAAPVLTPHLSSKAAPLPKPRPVLLPETVTSRSEPQFTAIWYIVLHRPCQHPRLATFASAKYPQGGGIPMLGGRPIAARPD